MVLYMCFFSVEEVLELQLFYPAFECGPVTLLHGIFQLPMLQPSKLAAGKQGTFWIKLLNWRDVKEDSI